MRHMVLTAALVWFLGAFGALAQGAVPEFRFLATGDTDFYGSDLDPQFDTALPACVLACAVDPACAAFTFNTRKNACFPKAGVTARTPYVGALSAEKIATAPEVMALAEDRAADLAFLRAEDLSRAAALARDLGLRHPAGGVTLQAALDAARARMPENDLAEVLNWTGVAVSLSDRADLWAEYARILLAIPSENDEERAGYEARATGAAINAFLRAEEEDGRAAALMTLAQALERAGRGAETVPALRLAAALQPREDIAAALDRAIAQFGFRIVDTSVESDAAAPRLCAEFSEPLVKAGVEYESFVRLPDPSLVVQAEGRQLCIDGVRHGSRYRVTFRAGLPAASGEALHKDVEIVQYVRDRAPSVRFPGRGFVLPKTADAAVPVETVNTGVLDLRLRRISDRNLLRIVQEGFFGRPLSHWQDAQFAAEIAEEIWTGSAETGNELNRDMTTRLPLGDVLAGQPPGIYALSARVPGADPYEDPGATQWFVLSDLGLSTLSGTDGLHVDLRRLSDAEPLDGIDVTLLSRANAVLGRAVTDADGHALFEPGLIRGTGGAAPAMVLAEQGARDIGFLSLTEPAFDLSDRGVEGRAPAGPVDVFLTTDRGAYRAGETIHATALARDPEARAIPGLPLIAVLKRPDGVDYARAVSADAPAGGHVFALSVAEDAPRGTWRVEIFGDPEAPALASQPVLVEDFLPERIDFDLALAETPLRLGAAPRLRIDARYLFGAPGADLSIEGQVTLRAAPAIDGWPGYRFGRHDSDFAPQSSAFGEARTDAAGQAELALSLPEVDPAGQPLEAEVIARLADGSARPVERSLTVPVRPEAAVIGIRPLFDAVVPEGTEAGFEVIGLGPDLAPTSMRVRWVLNRIETRYQWYQLYGDWNWEPTTRRVRLASGEADLGTAPLTLAQPVDWGRYELVVERLDGPYAAAALAFDAGWYAQGDASATPDRLELSLDKPEYRPGDTALLRIVPRSAGTALISVLSDRVIARQTVEVPDGETVIPLPVTGDWGTGAYVAATLLRPMDVAAGQNPARALGLAHARIEPVGKQLRVAIDAPEIARPRQPQQIRLNVDGAPVGEAVWLTLAAVDQGILNLTGFESPDPAGYYFGQRRLGVEMRDVYGRLIDGMNGAMGVVRSGGDAGAGLRMQSPPPTQKLMASFSGPVEVGPDGAATVTVDLPAFNGAVRLMAVAWSQSAVGQAEAEMLVRDPVVVTASLPHFLAPGDTARIRLEVAHADGPAGEMRLDLSSASPRITLGASPAPFTLAPGGKARFDIPVTAETVGNATLTATLTLADGTELAQPLVLPVRANDPAVAETRRFSLATGDTFRFTADVFAGLRPGTGRAVLSAGPLARFDAPGLLTALDRFPYGCTEQIASQTLPLLYLSSVAKAAGLGDGPQVAARIESAISRMLARQAPNGAFGLWRAEAGDFWLDAYVTDVLTRARAEGHAVPERALRLALDNLRNRIAYAPDFDTGGEDIAYALMVLAREGAAAMGDLRYYADVKGDAFATPLAAAQLGAALAAYGDQVRADAMFARAAGMIAAPGNDAPLWRADYGTALRDAAGVLALATEAASAAVDTDALTMRITASDAPLSTQEAAWSLLAAHALIDAPEASGLLVDGAPVAGPFVQVLDSAEPAPARDITAAGGAASEITLTTLGVPEVPPAAGGTGLAIERSFYTMEGAPIETPDMTVGARFVTVLRITPLEEIEARLIIDDPLPAGVEIDNPHLLRSGDVRALDWLQPSEATHAEFRADRFVAAVDLLGPGPVTLAYVARAVSPGDFHHPAASVEDMYRPRLRARTATGRMVVGE